MSKHLYTGIGDEKQDQLVVKENHLIGVEQWFNALWVSILIHFLYDAGSILVIAQVPLLLFAFPVMAAGAGAFLLRRSV